MNLIKIKDLNAPELDVFSRITEPQLRTYFEPDLGIFLAETGNVGLKYKTGGFLGAVGVVQVYSDLCLDCRTIIRSYIKEDTDKEWIHKPGSLGTR